MTRRRTPDLHDLVRELCETTQHREPYERRKKPRYHVTRNQPLLIQLLLTAYPSTTQNDTTSNHSTGSRPAANLDALDAIHRIRTDATRWLNDLGLDNTGRIITIVRRLTAATANVDHCRRARPLRDLQQPGKPVICCTFHRIEADVRRWWISARITTGWDLPPWRPANTCPICATRGSLRIRIIEKLASCTECHNTWDDTTIGLLADHIRTENGERQEAS